MRKGLADAQILQIVSCGCFRFNNFLRLLSKNHKGTDAAPALSKQGSTGLGK